MTRLKLLIATHEYAPFAGGIAVYVEELARAARGLGLEVTVLAPDYRQPAPISDEEQRVKRFSGAAFTPRQIPKLAARIASEARSHDLVHAADWGSLLSAIGARRIGAFRKPILTTLYGTESAALMNSEFKKRSGLAHVVSMATDHVAISEFTLSLTRKLPGMAQRDIRVTPLGVDPFWFQETSPGLDTGPREEIRLLTVARLEARKGHTTVISALGRCSPEIRRRAIYRVVGTDLGDGYLGDLERRAKEAGVNLQYLGRLSREEVRDAYRWADALMMPATRAGERVEGFGLVYLEAAAQRTPSVASDWGAAPEVVKDGVTGWVVPPDDPDAVAGVIQRLAMRKQEAVSIGAAAREAARAYTWERCAVATYRPWIADGRASSAESPLRS